MRKVKSGKIKATLLQGAGLYIAKVQRPVFDKNAESKKKSDKPNYYYIRRQLHNNQNKELKLKCARKKESGMS